MDEHEENVKNRLALSAMRQALGFLHRDDHYFDRMYGGAIAQVPLDGDARRCDIVRRFRRVLEETDARIDEILARGPRDEAASLANPIVKHELTDKEARDLDALHLAMHIFHPPRSLKWGHYEKGILIECMMECAELKDEFFDVLLDMERCIHYERRPSTEPEHQAARLAIAFVQQRKAPVLPQRSAEEEEEALEERLEEMDRQAGRLPKLR